jgi:hypothetical protein
MAADYTTMPSGAFNLFRSAGTFRTGGKISNKILYNKIIKDYYSV